MRRPIKIEPKMLIASVPYGKVSVFIHSEIPYRSMAPIKPPIPTASNPFTFMPQG